MEYAYEVRHLSADFQVKYPISQFPELEWKQQRPYTCLLLKSKDGYLICIPFRSNISHANAFMFRNSVRSLRTRSGLDYSKTILLKDASLLDTSQTIVDQDEYTEMVKNLPTIVAEISTYIDDYIDHINGTHMLHQREFARRYRFSTLPYFHEILFPDPVC